jgi:sigma-B regulation protein RsbU (phosphoserine phosphatase)
LGVLSNLSFSESVYSLHPGTHIVVLTDGVPEAMCNRELFGFERTRGISSKCARTIAEAARSFGQTDDITVLSIDLLLEASARC